MLPPDDFDPVPGVAERLQAKLRRIVAPNPSPMTYRGTNTYLLGDRGLAVIDPGPADDSHLDAILQAVEVGQQITHIIVTHAHLDHSPLAGPLARVTGAPVLAFGSAEAGRTTVMQRLAKEGLAGGGEGVDRLFRPDHCVIDGQQIDGDGWTLEVIHTPGHIGNHICLGWNDLCFTADHVMGWASSLVSPPDGDLTDFMASCTKLQQRSWTRFFPGHGAPVDRPAERLDWLISHRLDREKAILESLKLGPLSVPDITGHVYRETPAALLPAAQRNVLAHLIDLIGRSRARQCGPFHADVCFELNSDRAQ